MVAEERLMSQKEAHRLSVVQRVLGGHVSQAQASEQLQISIRQVKRLCRAVREHGASALISKRRGQPSNRCIDLAIRHQFVELVRLNYADFGPELAREYLAREHGFTHSVETLRTWMIEAQIWRPKSRGARRVHPPRERRACRGELVQIDGSHHAWFEQRGDKCCLIAFIDDATGEVLAARFFPTETTQAYFAVLLLHMQRHGVPMALYSDRAAIFTKTKLEDPVPTQFERAALQLHIESICALSPQAKGRVERLFQTLQDRMCKAMRLADICNIEDANGWIDGHLAQHNARFAVQPRETADAHRKPTHDATALRRICAAHHTRQLSNGLNCSYENQIIQVQPGQPDAPGGRAQVTIVQYPDDELELLYRNRVLSIKRYGVDRARNKPVDAKQINSRVDKIVEKQRKQLRRLKAQIEHQNERREQGEFKPDGGAKAAPWMGGKVTANKPNHERNREAAIA